MPQSEVRRPIVEGGRLGLSRKQKLQILGGVSAGFVLVCGVFEWRTLAGGGAWWLSPVLSGFCYLLVVPFVLTRFRVVGSTSLVETGVERQLVWWRSRVAWQDVAAIEARRRDTGRGGTYYVANLRTVSGREVPLRGVMGGSAVGPDVPFWKDLEQARVAWERSTGATEPVRTVG